MMDAEAFHAQREREFLLERALERAERNEATAEDLEIIRFECGKSKSPCPSQQVLADVFADFGNIFGKVQ